MEDDWGINTNPNYQEDDSWETDDEEEPPKKQTHGRPPKGKGKNAPGKTLHKKGLPTPAPVEGGSRSANSDTVVLDQVRSNGGSIQRASDGDTTIHPRKR